MRSVIQLSEDVARYARQVMAMHAEAQERGITPHLAENAALKKFEPLQENEAALIALRGDLMRLQTDMFEGGVRVTADQLQERMARMDAQGAFGIASETATSEREGTSQGSEAAEDGNEHLRDLLRARAAIEFSYRPDEQAERKYDRVTLQAVDNMTRQTGAVLVEQLLGDETILRAPDAEAELEARIKALARSLSIGVAERLRDAGGPTGGYYGGWQEGENGERVFDFGQVDVDRWAHKAKWGGAGLNEMRDEQIEPQEQADLLKGYFTGELAMLSYGKEAFRGGGAIDTLRLIARAEGQSEATAAEEYAGLLSSVRRSLNEEYQTQLDQAVGKIALAWDDEQMRYQLESDSAQA